MTGDEWLKKRFGERILRDAPHASGDLRNRDQEALHED